MGILGRRRASAEYDQDSDIVSRFYCATKGHVPDLMYSNKLDGTFKWYRFVTDWRGSVRRVVAADTGTVVQHLEYSPFGRVLHDSRPGLQPFGY